MLFRTVCCYQWSWQLNYKCNLMALAIWLHFRSSNFRHVTDNWELTVKIFTLKWGKDNERATSSFRYISEAIKKVLINSPCICIDMICSDILHKAENLYFDPSTGKIVTSRPTDEELYFDPATGKLSTSKPSTIWCTHRQTWTRYILMT